MKLSQVSKALALAAKIKRPVMLHGQPGIGKSQIVEQTCRTAAEGLHKRGVAEYGHVYAPSESPKEFFGLHDVRLSQCEPVDIRGLPVPDVESGTTKWLVPDWFPHVGRADLPDVGILFLDEVTNAPPSVQAAAYQITNDRRSGDHAMKKGWSIVLAGNRMTDGGQTFKMPLPLCNRLMHLYPEVDLNEWRAWAIDKGLPIEVVAFVAFRENLLNTFEEHVKERHTGVAFCTPRSWEIASDVIRAAPDHALLSAMLNGILGEGPAAEFLGFLATWATMPSIDGILLDPMQAVVPEDAATLFAVSTALASRASVDNIDQVCIYVDRMPAEFGILTIQDATRRHGTSLLQTPAFAKWASKNASLFGA